MSDFFCTFARKFACVLQGRTEKDIGNKIKSQYGKE